MTDGTRPNESDTPAPAPVPPYAARLAPGAPAPQSGVPRQEYPGAPPTWGPPAGTPESGAPAYGAPAGAPPYGAPPYGAPGTAGPWQPAPPTGGGSSVLGILALVASILGLFVAFVPFIGGAFAWALFIAAIVLAIIALVRRAPGKGLSIAALIVSVVGFGISIVWGIALLVIGGIGGFLSGPPYPDPVPDDEYSYSSSYPSLSAPELGADGNTAADPLAPGTTITLFDDNAGADRWEMTVQAPEDLTATALANDELDPIYGAYIGVPVQLTNVSDETIDLETDYAFLPYSYFLTADGAEAETAYLSDTVTYPSVWDLDTIEPGETVTFYEIYDVKADAAASASYVMDLDSGQTVYWGSTAF